MNPIEQLNGELMRLDQALRSGSVDLEQYRARRRKLLLDFEERQTTTNPGKDARPSPHPAELLAEIQPAEICVPRPPSGSAATAPRKRRAGPAIALVLLVVAGLALTAWWHLGSSPSVGDANPAAVAASPVASASPKLPQDVASTLLQTPWNQTDITHFLQDWSRLPPDSVRAASDDPRIWLLRGETDRRLRQAREAALIANTSDSRQRVMQLEQVQAAIRADP